MHANKCDRVDIKSCARTKISGVEFKARQKPKPAAIRRVLATTTQAADHTTQAVDKITQSVDKTTQSVDNIAQSVETNAKAVDTITVNENERPFLSPLVPPERISIQELHKLFGKKTRARVSTDPVAKKKLSALGKIRRMKQSNSYTHGSQNPSNSTDNFTTNRTIKHIPSRTDNGAPQTAFFKQFAKKDEA